MTAPQKKPSLVHLIFEQLSDGKSKAEILDQFKKEGWSESLLDSAFETAYQKGNFGGKGLRLVRKESIVVIDEQGRSSLNSEEISEAPRLPTKKSPIQWARSHGATNSRILYHRKRIQEQSKNPSHKLDPITVKRRAGMIRSIFTTLLVCFLLVGGLNCANSNNIHVMLQFLKKEFIIR